MDLVTFAKLEKINGINFDTSSHGQSSLDEWYSSVRNKPLFRFDENDICISLRQKLFPEHIIPLAMKHLLSEPLAGYKYEGELIVALSDMELSTWAKSEIGLSLVNKLNNKKVIHECEIEGCIEELNLILSKLSDPETKN